MDHWKTIGKVLGYLKKTISLRLFYSEFPTMLEGYSNTSWITVGVITNPRLVGYSLLVEVSSLRHQRNKRVFHTPPWNQNL